MSELDHLACRSCGQILDATPCPECGADAAVRIDPGSDAHPLARSIPTLAVIAFAVAVLVLVERSAMFFIGAGTVTTIEFYKLESWAEPIGRSLVDLSMISVAVALLLDRRSKGGRLIALFLATLPALTMLVVSLGDAIFRLFAAWKVWADGPELPFNSELSVLSFRFASVRALFRAIAILLLGVALFQARRSWPGRSGDRAMLTGLVALILPPTVLGMAATPSVWAMVQSYPDAPTILRVLWLSSTLFGSAAMLAGTMRWRAQQSSLLRAVGASPSDRGT
ncbi:MAG: hypothetical protein P8J59_03325 [Phycisphaerales bacterium]|nr:hypothetical protein [Phycisphaerales bacterium]